MTVKPGVAARAVVAAGEALLLALAVSAVLPAREILAGRYLGHGTYWLAAQSLLSGWGPRVGWGVAALAVAAGLFTWRGRAGPRSRGVRDTRPGPLHVAAAVAGIVLAGTAAGASLALPHLSRMRAEGHPAVIVVSIDTLRGDRLGLAGYPLPLTPHLDALGKEGIVFDQATSAAPWTLPSHVSIFTSMLPFEHGVRYVGTRIPSRLLTLAERFQAAGYRTAAFTGGGYVSWGYGFDQGFEIYEDHDERVEGGPGKIARAALEWVRRVRGSPFFLFVHTYEPHHPYVHDEFADPADAGRLHPGYDPDEEGIEELTPAERRYAVGLYDSDVAYADRILGGMLDELREEGVLDRAILVVLSDHGEDCWDHDAVSVPRHGHTLYQEMLHVPLLVRAPGLVPAGERIRTPVSLLDVAPTLLDLAGLAPASEFRGRSLAASCRTGVEPAPRPVYAESTRYGPDRFAVRDGDLKVIVTPFPDRIHEPQEIYRPAAPLEVFDLRTDPAERFDRTAHAPQAAPWARKLRERAAAELARSGEPDEDEPPERLIEQLRSLGYVE